MHTHLSSTLVQGPSVMLSRRALIGGTAAAVSTLIMGNSLDVLAQNISTLSDAINKAGSLRMLSQRMIKAWLQLISGILPEASQKILDDSIILFDRRLSDLKVYTAKNMATITLYESLEKEWNEFKKIIRVNTTDATTVNNVIAKSDKLRNRADAALLIL